MNPLYDRSGQVYAWVDKAAGRITDLTGRHVAHISSNNVYDYRGRHLGWWDRDHLRDRDGAVALYERDAADLGVFKPFPAFAPFRPLPTFAPMPALPALPSLRPFNRMAWSSQLPF